MAAMEGTIQMIDKPHNPYAFPLPMTVGPSGDLYDATQTDPGMGLRDYFAASSPIAMADAEKSLASEGHNTVSHAQIYKRLAQMRYAYADAMLTERAR